MRGMSLASRVANERSWSRVMVLVGVALAVVIQGHTTAALSPDGSCTAADVFPPGMRWEQQAPLVDSMFSRGASLRPQSTSAPQIVKATWARRTSLDAPVCGSDGRIEIVNKDMLPHQCRLVAVDPTGANTSSQDANRSDGPTCPDGLDVEQWARWNATKHMLLPQGHIAMEHTTLVVYFSVLPVGHTMVLPCNAKIVCPLVLGLAATASGPLLDTIVASEFEILIRSSQAEVALVTQEHSFLNSVLFSGMRRGPSTDMDTMPNADVRELDINRRGLRLRVSLTGDAFRVPLSEACTQRLGHAAQFVSYDSSVTDAVPTEDDDNNDPLLQALCLRERSEALRQVKAAIVAGFGCTPLPCLHANPVFNVSHLAVGGLPPGEAIDPQCLAGGPSWVRSAAAHAMGILGMDIEETSDARRVSARVHRAASQWRTAVSSASSTPTDSTVDHDPQGTLQPVLQADDVVLLQDAYAEVFVDAETLRRRGFFLPDVRQIHWWCRRALQEASLRVDATLCDALIEDGNAFAEAWRLEMGAFVRQPSQGKGRFAIEFDSAGILTHKAALHSVRPHRLLQLQEALDGQGTRLLLDAMDTTRLPPRGAKASDRAVPYVSVRYQVAHPQHDNVQWPRMDGNAFVPVTWNCIAGTNHTEACPMRFGVVAPYLVHGFELVLNEDSPEEHLLRHNSVFLVCPPSMPSHGPLVGQGETRCGSTYYGAHEAAIGQWFRRNWITKVRIDTTYRRLLLFDWTPSSAAALPVWDDGTDAAPKKVPLWEAFGKPIYLALRLPAGTVDDDMQYPMPLAGDDDIAAGHLYGFVVVPDSVAHPERQLDDEL